MTATGYRLGDPTLPPSPVTLDDLRRVEATVLWTDNDTVALARAADILRPQVEEILDVWYGFVGSNDFLVSYFSGPQGPDARYLSAVRERFGRWIIDTCIAPRDAGWLAYQEEIGRRHYTGKNETDGAEGTPPIVHFRYVNALIYPIYATIRPFLEKGGASRDEVDAMHQAWLKAVILQVTLWSRPYVREGAW